MPGRAIAEGARRTEGLLGRSVGGVPGEIIGQQVAEAARDLLSELIGTGGQVDAITATSSTIAMVDVADFLKDHKGIKDLVTKSVGANSKFALNPKAAEAVAKEIEKVVKLGSWSGEETMEWAEVKKGQPDARHVRGHLLLSIKYYEEHESEWKFKGRFAALGDQVKNIYGEPVTEEDLYTSPIGLVTNRFIIVHGLMSGIIMPFDIDNAYLKSDLKGPPTFISVPEKFRPSWINNKFRNPAQRLRKSLYGMKRAGYDYEEFARGCLIKDGRERVTDVDGSL